MDSRKVLSPCVMVRISPDWPKDYAEHVLEEANKKLAVNLLNSIGDGEFYAVRLREERRGLDEVVFRFDVMPVQTLNVVMPALSALSDEAAMAMSAMSARRLARSGGRDQATAQARVGQIQVITLQA